MENSASRTYSNGKVGPLSRRNKGNDSIIPLPADNTAANFY